MKNFIVCFQTPYNLISYTTAELTTPTFMGYKEFVKWLNKKNITGFDFLIEELDRFQTIYVDLDERVWEVLKDKEKDQEYSFEELYKYNEDKKRRDKNKKMTREERIQNRFNKILKKSMKNGKFFRNTK